MNSWPANMMVIPKTSFCGLIRNSRRCFLVLLQTQFRIEIMSDFLSGNVIKNILDYILKQFKINRFIQRGQKKSKGVIVTLTALPDAESVFSGWSGACDGKAACTLRLDNSMSVTVTFTPKQIVTLGDFNGDGEITPQDAVSIYEKSKEF